MATPKDDPHRVIHGVDCRCLQLSDQTGAIRGEAWISPEFGFVFHEEVPGPPGKPPRIWRVTQCSF
ncbi:MAG: hypothetical protein WKF37_08280 [Bryobacteraceae bacterium]